MTRPVVVPVRPGSPEWLAWRQSGYGASDAWTLLTGSEERWRTMHAVKLGLITEEEANPRMRWGLRLEDTIAAAYTEQTGHPVERVHAGLQHPEVPQMRATLDRRRKRGRVVVELKSWGLKTDEFGPDGGDVVPDGMLAQVQQQMAVTGYDQADVAVLFGLTKTLEVYRIGRDQGLIDNLVTIEQAAWAYVEAGQMPPYPGSPERRTTLKDDEVPASEEVVGAVAALEELQQARDASDAAVEEVRLGLRRWLEVYGGTRGTLPDGREFSVTHRYEKDRTRTDWRLVAQGYRHKLQQMGVADDELDFPVTALTVPEAPRRPLRVNIKKEATNAA